MVHQWTLPQMNPWSWRKVGSLYLCTCNVYVYSDTLDIIMKSSNIVIVYTFILQSILFLVLYLYPPPVLVPL